MRILVVISRPLAQLVPVKHGGQQFVAVSPVPPEPVEAVCDGLRRVFLDDETPAQVRYLPWARLSDLQAALAERVSLWMQCLGLEWLHRLCHQPWRWRRMLALPKFV